LVQAEAEGSEPLDGSLKPHNGFANRRLQPLGHADMSDAGASRPLFHTIPQRGQLAALRRSQNLG
jgi:hypothetical protein